MEIINTQDSEAREEIIRIRKRLFGKDYERCLNILNFNSVYGEFDILNDYGVINLLLHKILNLEKEVELLKQKKKLKRKR